MSNLEQVNALIKDVKSGKSDIAQLYKYVWENGAKFNPIDFDELFNNLHHLRKNNIDENSYYTLTEGVRFTFYPNLGNAYLKLSEAMKMFSDKNILPGVGACQAFLAIHFKNIGELDKAQEYANNSIKNIDNDPLFFHFKRGALYQAGEIHRFLNDYDLAIEFYQKGIEISSSSSILATRFLNALGNVYKDKKDFENAFLYFNKSLEKIQGLSDNLMVSKNYADIGNYYLMIGDHDQALNFQLKSLKIREDNKLLVPLITNYIELAELFLIQKDYEKALSFAFLAEQKTIEHNVILKSYQVNKTFSLIYEGLGNYEKSLSHFKKYEQIKNEVLNQENSRRIKQISHQHELESIQNEKEIFQLKNVVLKDALEEISASVRYAKRIQNAILPPIEIIKAKLKNSFVLYLPKDIVAGDFYWMKEIDDTILIAVADSTGHGVPGAMVSVVCSNALNRAVKEFDLIITGEILDKVTELVLETFENSAEEVKDGMDISLLSINKKTKSIFWSGANNPLWYYHHDTFNVISANKQSIGKNENYKPFTTHQIEYVEGSTFFLFTDGYADQFGGPHEKKYKYKPFQEQLHSNIDQDFDIQMNALEKSFNSWKGNLEQVDDVCVLGIKI